MRKAIFAGTFDPVHFGHIDVVKTASKLFDHVYWMLAMNPSKKPQFSAAGRQRWMETVVGNEGLDNVTVELAAPNLALVDMANLRQAQFLVRSFRLTADFEYELQLSLVNRRLNGDVQTVFIPPLQEHMHISSTVVRELIKLYKPVNDYMPEYLLEQLG